jgi:hypothetical protein
MIHRHKWEIRGARNIVVSYLYLGGQGYETQVLYVCSKCGKSKVKDLEGTWTLEQLRG